MGVNSDFGIKTAVDNSGIDSLIDRLSKMLDIVKTVEKQFGSVFDGVSKGAQKMSQSFVDADGKITKSRQESSERQKQILTEQVNAQEAATKRREEMEQRAAKLTEQADKMSTEVLVDHIFELQKKRESAMRAQKLAAAEGAKAEVAEQKKVIASLDEELGTLKKVSIQRKEVQKEGAGTKIGQLGTGREVEGFSGKSLVEMAGVGAAVEGLSSLVDKSKEVADAAHQMRIAFGQGAELKEAKEDAEKLGEQFGETGDEAGKSLSLIKSVTAGVNMTEEQRVRLTKAYIAAQEAGLPVAAKSLMTEQGRQKLLEEGGPLIKKAMDDAQDPAKQAQLAVASVEETGGELASTLLTDLNPAIHGLIAVLNIVKPILPELLIGIGAITVAMNAQAIAAKAQAIWDGALTVATTAQTAATWLLNAAMAVNPFVLIGIAVVALIAGIVLLVTHWKEVVDWFKKAAETVMNAGGALLHLLGITSDASAATKKHTDAVKDNSQSLADQKQSVEQVTQAYDDYSDALIKNQDEQKKSSDAETKRAEAAIVDIQKKLRYATGANKAMLEERLQQYIAYGKAVVSNAKTAAENEATAADEIGAGKDKKAKGPKGAKKAAKSKEDIAKESADTLLNARKEEIAAEKATDAQKHIDEINAEIVHATALLAIAQKFHGDKSAQAKSEQNKLTVLRDTLQKDERTAQLDDQKSATDDLLSDLEQRGIKESLSDYQIAQERYKIEQKALQDEITLRASWGEDVSKLQAQFDTAELKHADEEKKNTIAAEKELAQIKDEARKQNIQDMQAHRVAASVVAQAETKLALDEEETRHAEEMEKRKGNDALLEAEIADHTGKVTAITKAGADKQNQIWLQQAQFAAGPISNAFNNAFKGMTKGLDTWTDNLAKSNNFAQSFFGSLLQGFTQMVEGLIIKFVEFEAAFEVLNLITGGGAAAIMGAFNVAGALGIPGHAEGTDSSPGGLHWVGERGPELLNVPRGAQVIPNHRLNQTNAASVDLSPLLGKLDAIHSGIQQSNRTFQGRPAPVFPVNDNTRQIFNQSVNAEARRSA